MNAGVEAIACPFCRGRNPGALCLDCGRDKTAARRVCGACRAQTPMDEPNCQSCGRAPAGDLRWKLPLIVALFAAAFGVAVMIYAP